MKVLLTGARGYVGGELRAVLSRLGYDLHCLTRSSAPLPDVANDRHWIHDLRDPLAGASEKFDLVIHAAGANDIESRNPQEALESTALTARNIAAFAAGQGAKLIYLSTFQVYGLEAGVVSEDTPCRPRNDYALTHLFAEQWIAQYGITHGLPFLNLRLGNIAGMPSDGAMKRWSLTPGCFCRDATATQRIVVRSTGQQQRDFLSLAEIARRIVAVGREFDSFSAGAINIVGGAAVTIADIATLSAERYEAFADSSCSLAFEPPVGSTLDAPPPLVIGSRYLERYPAERLSFQASLSQLSSCIDDTYRYLQSQYSEGPVT